MRMWMVDPKIMCRKHLLGEHGELHKFQHNWVKRHRIDGRIEGNAMEPESYKSRHDQLAAEMLHRKMNHGSPIEQPDFSYLPDHHRSYRVDVDGSLDLLANRCPECRSMMNGGIQ